MLVYMSICLDLHALCFMPCFLCLDLSFPCVVWLDPHVSMLVYMSICLSYMLYALGHDFLCFVCLFVLTCSHVCVMLLALPCLDLCVYVCISMLYGYILVFTCLYAWIHVFPCLCARLVHVDVLFLCLLV